MDKAVSQETHRQPLGEGDLQPEVQVLYPSFRPDPNVQCHNREGKLVVTLQTALFHEEKWQ